MFKLNNKGFAVSAVLYTLLIAFLMFLGVTLAQFSSSITLINNANKDLVDGQVKLSAEVVIAYDTDENGKQSATPRPDIKVQIKSKYGTMYWPKDFGTGCPTDKVYKNIKVVYSSGKLTITNNLNTSEYKEVTVTCP